MGGERQGGVKVSKSLDKVSSIYVDPVVRASFVLALSFEDRASLGSCGLESLESLISGRRDGALLIRVEGAEEPFEAEVIVYRGYIVAAYIDVKGDVSSGSEALRKISSARGPCNVTIYKIDLEGISDENLKKEILKAVEEEVKAPPHAWLGKTLYGVYRVVEIIAGEKGAFSYVLKAIDPWGTEVALKVLKGEDEKPPREREVSKFVAEHAAQARLVSADRSVLARMLEAQNLRDVSIDSLLKYRNNIIYVYAVIAPRKSYSSMREYIESPPLAALELMDGDITRLSESDIERNLVGLITSVGGAMALAHAMGIGHFDVKPLNVLYKRVGGNIVFKLSDFVGYNVTLSGIVVDRFTIEYVDPLLLANRGLNATLDSDVFNFASFILKLMLKRNSECLAIVNTAIMQILTNRLTPIDASKRPSYARSLARTVNRILATSPSFEVFFKNISAEYEKCMFKEIEESASKSSVDMKGFLVKALSLERAMRPKNMIEAMLELGLL